MEIATRGVADLDELNALFTAWVEQVYHRRAHRETKQTPIERFTVDGVPDVPGPELLRQAFLWSQQRTVTKTATVSLAGDNVTVDKLRVHYGFTRTPFGRDLAPGQLLASRTHQEAVARLSWLIDETAIGVVPGEVGAGKTVAARAAVAALDESRHTVVYLPNPAIGGRGLHMHLVYALGAPPVPHGRADQPNRRPARRRARRAPQEGDPRGRRGPPARQRPAPTATDC